MNKLTHLLNRKYPSIYFLIVNFIIFFYCDPYAFPLRIIFNKTVTGILLVFWNVFHFIF